MSNVLFIDVYSAYKSGRLQITSIEEGDFWGLDFLFYKRTCNQRESGVIRQNHMHKQFFLYES